MTRDGSTSRGAPARRAAFKQRGRIVLTLFAVLILVGIVPLGTMSWKLIQLNRETLSTAEQEKQLALARSIARAVDLDVQSKRSELQGLAKTLAAVAGQRGTVPGNGIRRALEQVAVGRTAFIRFTYFEGQQVESVSAGRLPEFLEPLLDATFRRTLEVQARQHGADDAGALLFDPFLDETEPVRALMVLASPVVERGAFRGVLTSVIDLQPLWDVMVHRISDVAFAVDDEGRVFASSNPREVRPGQNLRGSELVRKFLAAEEWATSMTMPFRLIRQGEEQPYIGTFNRTAQGWGIFVQAPERGIYWSVRHMKRSTMLWAAALFGFAGLVSIVLARSLSNPIKELVAASGALARGDFHERVRVRSKNEIGELAHTFNTMADEIESYIRKLKDASEKNLELFRGTSRAMAQAIDAKDPYTRGHSERVSRYSMIIGRQLGLSEPDLDDLEVSSLLHDVGKIGIDDAILKKEGALTDEEYEIIKTHAAKGAQIMAPIPQMKKMIPGLRHHHERCDGRGYPDRLKRDEIPLIARIIAVADCFDAITTKRPYQDPMSFEAAVARINELKGDALDVRVVKAFNQACTSGQIRLEASSEAEPEASRARPSAEQPLLAGAGTATGG